MRKNEYLEALKEYVNGRGYASGEELFFYVKYEDFLEAGENPDTDENTVLYDDLQDVNDALIEEFNYILKNNGVGYYIIKNKNALKDFLKNEHIDAGDYCWTDVVELKNGRRMELRDI